MSARRIRCECGRVYQPAKNPTCPACGAEPNAATLVAPKPHEDDDASGGGGAEEPSVMPSTPFGPRTLIIAAAVVLALVLLVVFVRRKPVPKEQTSNPPPAVATQAQQSAAPLPTVTAAPTSTPIVTPSPTHQSIIVPQAFDLPAAIAAAAPGATVKVPPGFYAGGLIITKGLRLVGTSGQVLIQSEGREALAARAPGVFVQGIQFHCNGIGDLPAISVADGADLELDACRIQSSTTVGVSVAGNAALKAIGTTFSASSGTAVRLQRGRANLTQSSFPDARVGLSAAAGAAVELKSCAFDRNGTGDSQGAIISATGQGTLVTANDCHFTGNNGGVSISDGALFTATSSSFKENGTGMTAANAYGVVAVRRAGRATISNSTFEGNRIGVAVSDGGTAEMSQCAFSKNGGPQSRQLNLPTMPISVTGQGSSIALRNTTVADSTQFAIAALSGASVLLEDVEITRARVFGFAMGDANTPPVQAEIRRSRFHHNGTGLGVYAGSTVKLDDSEIRENNDGIMLADPETQLEMTKTRVIGNKEHGLGVFTGARATARECEFRHNARGVQSGLARKSTGRASVVLEDCAISGNRAFGVGAHAHNELILTRVNFEGGDKTNIFKERNAIVQTEATPPPEASVVPDASPSPSATEKPEASPTPRKRARPTPRARPRRPDDHAARILREIFGPR